MLFHGNVQLSLTFLSEECWKAVTFSTRVIIQKNYHGNFKTATQTKLNSKSTSMWSVCSLRGQDKTLWDNSRQDADAICCWWTCCCQLGGPCGAERDWAANRKSALINPQQPNSCHPTHVRLPPIRLHPHHSRWIGQLRHRSTRDVKGKEAVVRDF